MNNRKIPKVIYYTYKTTIFPQSIIDIIEYNKKMCPEYDFKFFDDDMCDKFIKDNFDEKTYKAYNKINPKLGAMKADFWRYCVLYKNGGIYLDIKIRITMNLDTIITDQDTCIFMPPHQVGPVRIKNNIPVYEQWLLIFEPKHIYLEEMIKKITDDILNEYNPSTDILSYEGCSVIKHKVLHVTGPDALARIISNTKGEHRISYEPFYIYDDFAKFDLYHLNNIDHYSVVDDQLYI
jgi:mannosyltransferase OCH1-like enzyme